MNPTIVNVLTDEHGNILSDRPLVAALTQLSNILESLPRDVNGCFVTAPAAAPAGRVWEYNVLVCNGERNDQALILASKLSIAAESGWEPVETVPMDGCLFAVVRRRK